MTSIFVLLSEQDLHRKEAIERALSSVGFHLDFKGNMPRMSKWENLRLAIKRIFQSPPEKPEQVFSFSKKVILPKVVSEEPKTYTSNKGYTIIRKR